MTTLEPSAFGDALRQLRREAGLTQEELAERAGLSVRGLSDLERGLRRTPRPGTARLLADALDLHGALRERLLTSRQPRSASPSLRVSGGEGRVVNLCRNVQVEVTTLVDRERETRELSALVAKHRLVTLSGPGGVGKTRLAMHLAWRTAESFADGVCVVELAALTQDDLVAGTIAAALEISQRAGRPTAELLTEVLQDQHRLLVLDNCEQVIAGVAALLAVLTRSCPRLHVLATSRERLALAGEVAWPLEPLAVPPPAPAAEATRLAEMYPAVRLFVDRARAAQPRFELDERNVGAVAEVCRRLDGLPLAIELAAARTPLLSVQQIAERLDDRFRLLTSGPRSAPSRHRALWDAIAWSFDLLTDDEQQLLRTLSVFAAGFTLEAAEAVGGPIPWWSTRLAAWSTSHWSLFSTRGAPSALGSPRACWLSPATDSKKPVRPPRPSAVIFNSSFGRPSARILVCGARISSGGWSGWSTSARTCGQPSRARLRAPTASRRC